MNKTSINLDYYMGLPFSIEITRDTDDENPGWVAKVRELPGCITQADNFEELEGLLLDAMRSWIEVALEDGIIFPEPCREDDYSGKFVVRLPKSLHRELVEFPEKEGVSLNTWVIHTLAKSVGQIGQSSGKARDDQFYRKEKRLPYNRIIADKS